MTDCLLDLQSLLDLLYIPWVCEWTLSFGGMIAAQENVCTLKTICHSATLPTTHATNTVLGENPVKIRQSYGTA